jgi:hypothetical protein
MPARVTPTTPVTDRQWVLISHANPEDNVVATWFATQLANDGYRVWSDVICLIGGEDFWRDIEEVIRYRAVKVVYLLSRASNQKDGCLKELHAAQGVAKKENLKDFIIPLRIDDIPYSDVNIRISNLNIVESRAWKDGLSALLNKLLQDGVPRRPTADHREISAWWKARFSTSQSVRQEPEILLSNWFKVQNEQLLLYRHRLRRTEIGLVGSPGELPWPTIEDQTGIWTYAHADAVSAHLAKPYYIDKTDVETITHSGFVSEEVRQHAFRLLLVALELMLRARGLIPHGMAGGKQCFAFPKGLVEDDEVSFELASGKKARRAMVGYKTRFDAGRNPWTRYWHFAIQPIPIFRPEMVIMGSSPHTRTHQWRIST